MIISTILNDLVGSSCHCNIVQYKRFVQPTPGNIFVCLVSCNNRLIINNSEKLIGTVEIALEL